MPDSGAVTRLIGAGLVHQPNLELTALSRDDPAVTPVQMFVAKMAAAPGFGAEADEIEIMDRIAELVASASRKATMSAQAPDPAQFVSIAVLREVLADSNTHLAI